MIRFRDALTLARTKIRTHRIRTALSIVVAALLFGVLLFVVFVSTGVFDSIERFSKYGLTGRYIAAGYVPPSKTSLYQDKDVMAIAKKMYDEELVMRKAKAKELGLSEAYAINSLQNPIVGDSKDKDAFVYMNMSNPIAIKAIEQFESGQKVFTQDDFATLAKQYGATKIHTSDMYFAGRGELRNVNEQKTIDEVMTGQTKNVYTNVNTITQRIVTVPDSLIESYKPAGYEWNSKNATVPVYMTQDQVVALLNLKKLDEKAPNNEKLEYAKTLRKQAIGKKIQLCYRNEASQELLRQAYEQSKITAEQKKRPEYVVPSLQLELPSVNGCDAVKVTKDTRSREEKAMLEKERAFGVAFGKEAQDPYQAMVDFEIVGITPSSQMGTMSNGGATMVGSLVSMMLASTLPEVSIAQSQLDALPKDHPFYKAYKAEQQRANYGDTTRAKLAEFTTSEQLKKFIDAESCEMSDGGCKNGKRVMISSFGSNSVALDGLKKGVQKVMQYTLLVIAGLAVIILGFTVSRAIADGRRETAVFRAIGFKRSDIAAVYMLYSQLLAVWIVVDAVLIAVVGAVLLNHHFWVDLTAYARLLYAIPEKTETFQLLSFNSPYVVWVIIGILLSALVATFLPLLRNVRRNPIQDMRDE